MKIFANLPLIAMVAIATEKSFGKYLLVEVEDEPVPTPRECCEDSNIPEFCLGLCSPPDAMARQEKRLTACSQYETTIEKCFHPIPDPSDVGLAGYTFLENHYCGGSRIGDGYSNLNSAASACNSNSYCDSINFAKAGTRSYYTYHRSGPGISIEEWDCWKKN